MYRLSSPCFLRSFLNKHPKIKEKIDGTALVVAYVSILLFSTLIFFSLGVLINKAGGFLKAGQWIQHKWQVFLYDFNGLMVQKLTIAQSLGYIVLPMTILAGGGIFLALLVYRRKTVS